MSRRLFVAMTTGVLFLLAMGGPAAAAAPSNDTYAGRVTITSIPFSDVLDTTDATNGPNDNDLGACFAPAYDATVWYEVTGTGQQLTLDVRESSYSAGVIVATGSPGNFELVDCGAGVVPWSAEAGTVYTIMVFDDQRDGSGNGGTMRISVTGEVASECTITGTEGDDVLVGTTGDDHICGLGGNDVLIGFRGNDVLVGGPGHDVLEGYDGRDTLVGGRGRDVLIGGRGFDTLNGGRGRDRCFEAAGPVTKCERGSF